MFVSRLPHWSWQTTLVVTALGVTFCASQSKAGIICPAPVRYDAADLDRALGASTASSGSSQSKNSDSAPLSDNERNQSHPDHLKTAVPLSQSSSSSSSSSAGGASGSGAVACALSNRIAIADDLLLGRLPEDYGLSLPDPPGTDLLRPPRVA